MLTLAPQTVRTRPAKANEVILEARVVCGTGGGPDKTIFNSPRFLTSAGYDTVCAYMHPPGDPGFDDLRAKAQMRGVKLLSVADRGAWDWRVVPQLLNICRRERVKIWHGHDYKSNALGLILNQFWPMRLVTTLHGWVKHTKRTPLYYWVDKKCLPHYESVICVSDDLYQHCMNNGIAPEKCHLIENGIDVDEFTRRRSVEVAKREIGLNPNDFAVVAVGRLSPEKGFDILIQAISMLKDQGILVHLLIAGSGDAEPELRTLIADHRLGDQVRLLGHVTDPKPIYEAADVVALSSYREGLPNVLLEAMALEVPVVATRVNGVPGLVNDGVNGLLVAPGSVGELAEAIRRLAGDSMERGRLAAAGRQTIVDRYSFSARMEKVRAVYDRLLNRSSNL
jgi:glycosyltransferase involved in cell wall biosynthesis